MKIYYIVNARMPNEKAHGIQIAKMCEALIEVGIDLTLVIPARATSSKSIRDYYNLRVEVPTVALPVFDFYNGGRIWFAISSVSFMVSYLIWGLFRVEKKSTIYTCDIDTFSYSFLPFLGRKVCTEMHGGKRPSPHNRFFFRYASAIATINASIRDDIQKSFLLPAEKFIIEPNGVDLTQFVESEKTVSRKKLGLNLDTKLCLYVGRAIGWKSLNILVPAARRLPPGVILGFLGASQQEFTDLTGETDIPPNLVFYGGKPFSEVPLWLSAADSLLVLGTKENIDSYKYTSPMKIFEYMAMRRPIVASRTIAISEIVDDTEVVFYEPDDVAGLAQAIQDSFSAVNKTTAAFAKVQHFTWKKRAERILAFMARVGTLS